MIDFLGRNQWRKFRFAKAFGRSRAQSALVFHVKAATDGGARSMHVSWPRGRSNRPNFSRDRAGASSNVFGDGGLLFFSNICVLHAWWEPFKGYGSAAGSDNPCHSDPIKRDLSFSLIDANLPAQELGDDAPEAICTSPNCDLHWRMIEVEISMQMSASRSNNFQSTMRANLMLEEAVNFLRAVECQALRALAVCANIDLPLLGDAR